MQGMGEVFGSLSVQDALALTAAFFSALAFLARWRAERDEHEALIEALETIADRLGPPTGAPALEGGEPVARRAGRWRVRSEQVYGALALLTLIGIFAHALTSGRP